MPAGLKQIKVATRYMAILGRIYADGTEQDFAAVNALQAQLKIVPLSGYGKFFDYKPNPVLRPGFSMTDKPQAVILKMSASVYFNMLAGLMNGAAPAAARKMRKCWREWRRSAVAGQPFNISALNGATQAALKTLPMKALR